MHRTPLAATIVLATVLGALVAASGAAWAVGAPATTASAANRGWEIPDPDAVAALPR